MKDVDIDTQADRSDGWTSQASNAQGKSLAREEVHKSLSAVLHPHILALSPFALYTLHNDVYPVVPTGTIVPKVNI